jgi:hypothetical protein
LWVLYKLELARAKSRPVFSPPERNAYYLLLRSQTYTLHFHSVHFLLQQITWNRIGDQFSFKKIKKTKVNRLPSHLANGWLWRVNDAPLRQKLADNMSQDARSIDLYSLLQHVLYGCQRDGWFNEVFRLRYASEQTLDSTTKPSEDAQWAGLFTTESSGRGVVGILEMHDLKDVPPFKSLSYTLGPPYRDVWQLDVESAPEFNARLIRNGKPVSITQNVYDALVALTEDDVASLL